MESMQWVMMIHNPIGLYPQVKYQQNGQNRQQENIVPKHGLKAPRHGSKDEQHTSRCLPRPSTPTPPFPAMHYFNCFFFQDRAVKRTVH